jgi:superoxide dismutase, Cu-Zn family
MTNTRDFLRSRRSCRLAVALVSLGLLGCKGDAEPERATARLVDAQGRDVGTATLREIEEGVLIELEIQGMPAGEHGMHVHERGECTAPDFESAGEHLALGGARHGLADEGWHGAHAGDLVNLVVDDAGQARTFRVVIGATLDRDAAADSPSLLRPGGTAIVVHDQPDDYRSEPAGASGERIACGVVEPAARG